MDMMEIDDDVYINRNLTLEGLVTKVDIHRGKKPSRCVTMCLGLLCALLLAGNIGQFIYYEIVSHHRSADPTQASYIQGDQLQSHYDALTAERKELEDRLTDLTTEKDQLQQSYDSLTAETDEFKASFNNLKNEWDQLQASYNTLKQENDQLQTSHNNLTVSYDQLQTNYSNLQKERDQWQKSYKDLSQSKNQLQRSCYDMQMNLDRLQTNHNELTSSNKVLQNTYSKLQRERDELLTTSLTLRANRDQLQNNYTSLKRNNDQLQRNYDTLSRSKNLLDISYTSLWKDKQQLQTRYNTLRRENQQLQTNYSSLVTIRDQLERKINKLTAKPCQAGWRKFDISCYFVSTLTRNWTMSRNACIAEGADLVVIDSREEQEFVNGLLQVDQNAWIGLTDSLEEGTWMWVDGTPLTTGFWQPGQPNSFNGNQDCGEIVQKSVGMGEWNDDGCFSQQLWICEK
ncbi:CD209 antigen-like [Epinephelus fuscoguttatus]|uniref:CD209 antigen-like n=1 Tax=Epinephelus fuscoguttatus TaxID=293821 RepID=UPI0020D06DB3|nr:CD209 antigen-like [Epinephelus fuscoguttatus]